MADVKDDYSPYMTATKVGLGCTGTAGRSGTPTGCWRVTPTWGLSFIHWAARSAAGRSGGSMAEYLQIWHVQGRGERTNPMMATTSPLWMVSTLMAYGPWPSPSPAAV
jgi:hypothetical protein